MIHVRLLMLIQEAHRCIIAHNDMVSSRGLLLILGSSHLPSVSLLSQAVKLDVSDIVHRESASRFSSLACCSATWAYCLPCCIHLWKKRVAFLLFVESCQLHAIICQYLAPLTVELYISTCPSLSLVKQITTAQKHTKIRFPIIHTFSHPQQHTH